MNRTSRTALLRREDRYEVDAVDAQAATHGALGEPEDVLDGTYEDVSDDAGYDGEQLDLADRQALRRVAGLSTELADVTEVEYRQLRLERVVLAGVWTDGGPEEADNSLRELAALAETAGSQVLEGLVQRREQPDPSTFLGSGKARELRDVVVRTGADTVICDGELSPSQRRALEDVVKVTAGRWSGRGRCGDRLARTR